MNENKRVTREVRSQNPRVNNREAGSNISWSSIFAGTVTFIAVSVVFSLIGSAIGFGATDLTSNDPLQGVGIGLVLWTIFSLIVSLGASGFVSGLAAGRTGLLHGFLAWTLSITLIVLLLSQAISGIFGMMGNVLGFAGNAVGSTVSSVASGVSGLTQEAFDKVSENITFEKSGQEIEQDVTNALENSDIDKLQPEYLENQVNQTIEDIKNGGKAILVDGEDFETVFNNITTNIENRITDITSDINREDVERIISENTELTEQETTQAVDNVINEYNEASAKASEAIENAKVEVEELKVKFSETAEDVVETTDDALNSVSKYSVITFIGLIISAVITTFAGKLGSKMAQENKFFLA